MLKPRWQMIVGMLLATSAIAVTACSSGDTGLLPRPTPDAASADDAGGSDARGDAATERPDTSSPDTGLPVSHRDGIKNLGESDIDCGGVLSDTNGLAPRCPATKACADHGDCASDGCNAETWTCALGKSCAQIHGGQTCGKGELGDPNHLHESCCETVTLNRPSAEGGAFTLDKYVVTAGRFRQFLQRTNGNVSAALRANPKWSLWTQRWGAWAQYLPTNMQEAENLVDGYYKPWEWESPKHRLPPTDPEYFANGISAQGCFIGPDSGGGGHSYYLPEDGAGTYGQAQFDEKMMNCVHPFMIEAFCMWDGGQMWDESQLKYTWNGASSNQRRFPWGSYPEPIVVEEGDAPNPTHVSSNYLVHGWNYPHPTWEAPFLPTYRAGAGPFALPPPGRRPMGYARASGVAFDENQPLRGVADVAGGVFQFVWSKPSSYSGWSSAGSFEAHNIGEYGYADVSNDRTVPNRRYYAVGGRCVR